MFIDEIHRFNRAQQDGLLAQVEDGTVTLIGATTENPSFALTGALLSRCQVLVLNRLDAAALDALIARAEGELGHELPLDPAARARLAELADGDGRYLLNMVENLADLPPKPVLDPAGLAQILQRRMPLYDRQQEAHYNLISALHKSVRGSDPDAALYWLARMLLGGEDPRYVARRLVRMAAEDIGLADPAALPLAIAASQAYEQLGSPEGELALAECTVHLACAPKSNALYRAFNEAWAAAKESGSLMPPLHILNAPTRLMKDLGYGAGLRLRPRRARALLRPELLSGRHGARRPSIGRPARAPRPSSPPARALGRSSARRGRTSSRERRRAARGEPRPRRSSGSIAGSAGTSRSSATATCRSCCAAARSASTAAARRPTRGSAPASASASRRSASARAGAAGAGGRSPPADAELLRSLILHQDDALLVLDKPAGLAVQGGTGTRRHLDGMLPALADGGERPRLVHRLDRDTSGLLVVARTARAAAKLTEAFRRHQVPKLYWALVVGRPQLAGRPDRPAARQAAGRQGRAHRARRGRRRGAHPLPHGRARRPDRELARAAAAHRAHPSAARALPPARHADHRRSQVRRRRRLSRGRAGGA